MRASSSTPPATPGRTLTVFSRSGLCNRLKVLLSGLALAEDTGRELRVLWPLTRPCAAQFDELFENDLPVETIDDRELDDLPYLIDIPLALIPDLRTRTLRHLCYGHVSWLIYPDRFPEHARLLQRCAKLMETLRPCAGLRNRVRDFHERCFRPQMIGVHLRRGDFLRRYPLLAANTGEVLLQIDRFLQQQPDAGIFLSSDDGGVDQETGAQPHEGLRQTLALRYGERVVWTEPRSLDRRTTVAIQDAVVDLWLLRQTDFFVGTLGSSFSELAIFGREIPSLMCPGRLNVAKPGAGDWILALAGLRPFVRNFVIERLPKLHGAYRHIRKRQR